MTSTDDTGCCRLCCRPSGSFSRSNSYAVTTDNCDADYAGNLYLLRSYALLDHFILLPAKKWDLSRHVLELPELLPSLAISRHLSPPCHVYSSWLPRAPDHRSFQRPGAVRSCRELSAVSSLVTTCNSPNCGVCTSPRPWRWLPLFRVKAVLEKIGRKFRESLGVNGSL